MSELTRRDFVVAAGLLGTSLAAGGTMTACSSSSDTGESDVESESESTFDPDSLDVSDWDAVVEAARGATVNWWMSASTAEINDWVDGPCAQTLKEKYDITLNRVPASSQEFVTQISAEIEAGTEEGSVDMIWCNGSEFSSLKENGYLYGPIMHDLSNAEYVDWDAYDNKYDAGVETEGYSFPWHRYTASFFADTSKTGTDLPSTPEEYLEWIQQFPGRVTYPAAGDSQGNRFMYTIFANIIGRDEWEKIATDLTLTKEDLREMLAPGFSYLRDLNPYLWNEGTTFPAQYSELDTMYADGEVYTNFNVRFPQAKVNNGTYPADTTCFAFSEADLCYNSYIEIPANATNKAAALVAINEICGPELELSKFQATLVPSPLDYSKLTEEQREALDATDLGKASLNPNDIEPIAIALASGTAIELIEELWQEEVVGQYNE